MKKRVTRKQLLKAVVDSHNDNPILRQLEERRKIEPCDCPPGKIHDLCSTVICPRRWTATGEAIGMTAEEAKWITK